MPYVVRVQKGVEGAMRSKAPGASTDGNSKRAATEAAAGGQDVATGAAVTSGAGLLDKRTLFRQGLFILHVKNGGFRFI